MNQGTESRSDGIARSDLRFPSHRPAIRGHYFFAIQGFAPLASDCHRSAIEESNFWAATT